ncbi:MAG: cobalamin-binding protein [Pseudomonadota bacterium]
MRCRLLLAAWLASFAVNAASFSLTDDRGKAHDLPASSARIVTLAPHLTELVYAAGAGDRLIAVDGASDYPPAVHDLPRIGDASRLDFEAMLQLRPDLVLAWRSGNNAADIAQLERLGLDVFVTEPERLSDIARLLRVIGHLAGSETAAAAAAQRFEAELDALRARYRGRREVSVFYQIWYPPPMTVNRAHAISDALGVCGARNVFADLPQLAGAVATEAVVAINPEAMVLADGAPDAEAAWRRFADMRAVRANKFYTVTPDLLHRAGPRMLQGVAELCEKIDQAR